jgi:hypothetical protein
MPHGNFWTILLLTNTCVNKESTIIGSHYEGLYGELNDVAVKIDEVWFEQLAMPLQ